MARHGASAVTVVAPGAQADALALLPMPALRIPEEVADGLRRLGLDLVGQLYAAPRGPLTRRFGDALLPRLDQALGRVAEPIRPVLPPGTISIRQIFVELIATAEAFAAVVLVLVADACAALQARGAGARTLDLLFERVDGSTQAVRVGTARPVRNPMHLAHLLDERIETVDPGFGVEAMRLTLSLFEPLAPAQHANGLGGGPGEADIAALIDRLSNRLGAGRVYRVAPVDSDAPERAVAAVPPLAASGGQGWATPWPRPALLLPRPELVDAVGLLPNHPPRWFTWRWVRHRVVRADRPERIAGKWWRRPSERAAVRGYWVVEDEGGCRFWLFRRGDGLDPATGGLAWFLHGFSKEDNRPMTDDDKRTLHPATAAELEESLSFALRYAGKRRVHMADDVMARVTAERLVQHLERSGYVLMKRPAASASVLHGPGGKAQSPQPPRLRSGGADVARASELRHAVERVDGDVHLGRPTAIRARAQPRPRSPA